MGNEGIFTLYYLYFIHSKAKSEDKKSSQEIFFGHVNVDTQNTDLESLNIVTCYFCWHNDPKYCSLLAYHQTLELK